MNLSALGKRLTGESGTRSLMDDLGAIATAGGGIMNLGGGNPSLIPAAENVFRARMQAFMQRDRRVRAGRSEATTDRRGIEALPVRSRSFCAASTAGR